MAEGSGWNRSSNSAGSLSAYFPFAQQICFVSPSCFGGNRFHYWTYVFIFGEDIKVADHVFLTSADWDMFGACPILSDFKRDLKRGLSTPSLRFVSLVAWDKAFEANRGMR